MPTGHLQGGANWTTRWSGPARSDRLGVWTARFPVKGTGGPDSLRDMAVSGETAHAVGIEGSANAHAWLDGTTRTNAVFTNLDPLFGDLLKFNWASEQSTFSFDLGGKFLGGQIDGHGFAAEVKNYANLSDLPTQYHDFLAKCYVTLSTVGDRFRHFLWISTVPLSSSKWQEHTQPANVVKALLQPRNISRALGAPNEEEARTKIDHARTVDVASRLWMITLNGHEPDLIPTREDYSELTKHRMLKGSSL